MRLEGKVALVTGGGSGIGRATVRLFVEEGAHVVAADVNEEGLRETVDGLGEAASTVALDVGDSGAVDAAFATLDRLDVLVNAAGVVAASPEALTRQNAATARALASAAGGERAGPEWNYIEATTDEDFEGVVRVNLLGTFYCLRAAVPLLTRAGGGSIVNIASVAALVGAAMPLGYPASKAGVLGLTRAAAAELAQRNIRVNALAPGAVDTPLLRSGPEGLAETLVRMQPIARAASPWEIAASVLFLASDDGAYYTGQTLSPNGGMSM
jgi:3-oxoacyl-[acyl-carrier protein] reductase